MPILVTRFGAAGRIVRRRVERRALRIWHHEGVVSARTLVAIACSTFGVVVDVDVVVDHDDELQERVGDERRPIAASLASPLLHLLQRAPCR